MFSHPDLSWFRGHHDGRILSNISAESTSRLGNIFNEAMRAVVGGPHHAAELRFVSTELVDAHRRESY